MDKEQWIINYIKNKKDGLPYVDMLDEYFVGKFIEEFEVESKFVGLGASQCKELSKILSSMYKKGLLDRWAHGVKSGMWQDSRGFKYPKWFYSYKLPSA